MPACTQGQEGKTEGGVTGEVSNPKDVSKKHTKTMNLTRVTLLWGSCLPRRHRMPDKKPSTEVWDTSPQICGWRCSGNPQNSTDCCIVVLGCLTKLHSKASLLKTIAEGTTYTGHRIPRNQVGTDQDSSYL